MAGKRKLSAFSHVARVFEKPGALDDKSLLADAAQALKQLSQSLAQRPRQLQRFTRLKAVKATRRNMARPRGGRAPLSTEHVVSDDDNPASDEAVDDGEAAAENANSLDVAMVDAHAPTARNFQSAGDNSAAVNDNNGAATDNVPTPMSYEDETAEDRETAAIIDAVDDTHDAVSNHTAVTSNPDAQLPSGDDEIHCYPAGSAIAHALKRASLWESHDDDDGNDDDACAGAAMRFLPGPEPTYIVALHQARDAALTAVQGFGGLEPGKAIVAPRLVRRVAPASGVSKGKRLLSFPRNANATEELAAYIELAAQLLCDFENWQTRRGPDDINEKAMCHALRGSDAIFSAHCHAKSPHSVMRAIELVESRACKSTSHVLLARLQLARWMKPRRQAHAAARASIARSWKRAFHQAESKGRDVERMEQSREASYQPLPEPLDALLPPLQNGAAAVSARSKQKVKFGRWQRCGVKLWQLIHIYGSGVLVLREPVLQLSSLYQCSAQSFEDLRAELPQRPIFADLMAVVSAAYESTVLGCDTSAIEQLRRLVSEPSVSALRRASEAAMRTLQALRQPDSPMSPLPLEDEEEDEEEDVEEGEQAAVE